MSDIQDKNEQRPAQSTPQPGQRQSGQQSQPQTEDQAGRQPERQKNPQEDSIKKNPSQGGQEATKDEPGQRRAS